MGCIHASSYDPSRHTILGSYSSLAECEADCTESSSSSSNVAPYMDSLGFDVIQKLKEKGIEIPEYWD